WISGAFQSCGEKSIAADYASIVCRNASARCIFSAKPGYRCRFGSDDPRSRFAVFVFKGRTIGYRSSWNSDSFEANRYRKCTTEVSRKVRCQPDGFARQRKSHAKDAAVSALFISIAGSGSAIIQPIFIATESVQCRIPGYCSQRISTRKAGASAANGIDGI